MLVKIVEYICNHTSLIYNMLAKRIVRTDKIIMAVQHLPTEIETQSTNKQNGFRDLKTGGEEDEST